MRPEITAAIRQYGEPVIVTPKGGAAISLTASVQAPVVDPIVNDEEIDGFFVYISPDDLPNPPQKYDRFLIRGKTMAAQEDASVEYFGGQPLVYMVRVNG